MKPLSVFVLFALCTTMALAPPARAQDDSVILPEGSIDATDIFDETGAAQSLDPIGVVIVESESFVVVESSTIINPTSGYVLTIGSGHLRILTPQEFLNIDLGVSDDCDAMSPPMTASIQYVSIRSQLGGGASAFPFSTQRSYLVSAGAQTFCIVARSLPANSGLNVCEVGTCTVERLSLSLLFFPTAYGTVESP